MVGIMFMVYLYIPESPYWCATHGFHDRGRAIIDRLHGRIDGYDVDFHYSIVRRTVEMEQKAARELHGERKSFWQDILDTREIFYGVNGVSSLAKASLITVPYPRRFHACGYPAAHRSPGGKLTCFRHQLTLQLSSYSSYFAQLAAFADPFMFTLLLSIVAIVTTIICAVVVDFVGRRNLFLGSTLVIWCCLMIIGGLGLMPERSHSMNQLTVFFSLVWRMGSTVLGDLGWSYVAETGSMRLRAKTAGFSAAGGVCFGLIFSTTVPYMVCYSRC